MTAAPSYGRTPVLVGIGTITQREEDFTRASEPLDLMIAAARAALADAGAGAPGIGARVQRILVPKGRWRYADPGREVGQAIGAPHARSVLADVGVLQQTLIADACTRIAAGEIDCALVVGADAGYRMLRARIAQARAGERQQASVPDERMQPREELLHPAELEAGIRMPVPLYAVIDSAWRARAGIPITQHRRELGALYEQFAAIAADNPHAWRGRPLSATEIAEPSQRNPMQAFPYNRAHCSSWNVDQAGALLLCAADLARKLAVPQERWIHPLASAESNHMLPVSARADIARCPGAEAAAQALLGHAGLAPSQLDLLDLYSCFPVAVKMHAQALAVPAGRPLTVTGAMPFAGGPFNNYVLQATCRMAQLLREGRGAHGVVSSVSGILTKHGFGLWARGPGSAPFASLDASAAAAAGDPPRPVLAAHHGHAQVVGYTIVAAGDEQPDSALVLAQTPAGERVWARSQDRAMLASMQHEEHVGRTVLVEGNQLVRVLDA